MFIVDVDDLRHKKAAFIAKFKFEKMMKKYTEGDGTAKKPCWTK